jgi:hypothetical protein
MPVKINKQLLPLGCLCLMLLPHWALAQNKHYALTGDMGIQGGELFTYQLVISDTADNGITGYAYTWLTKGKDVKAKITGTIDRVNKTMHIRETEIVYNHGFQSNAIICLVESDLKYDNHTLSGNLSTHTNVLGAECARGSITFSHQEELSVLFNRTVIADKVDIAKDTSAPVSKPARPVKIVYDTAIHPQRPVVAQTVKESVTEGKDKMYYWHTDTITLQVWDDTKVDGDEISIAYNGNVVLDRYSLTKEKKTIQLAIPDNELNIIVITALNEGNEPPNTANVLLIDGTITHNIVAYNYKGRKSIIKVKKLP